MSTNDSPTVMSPRKLGSIELRLGTVEPYSTIRRSMLRVLSSSA